MKRIILVLFLLPLIAKATDNFNILDNTSATISGGTINNTAIGGTTPAAGAFTTLSATTPLPVTSGGTGVAASTGTGSTVLSTNPVLISPALGTPSSGVATNLTGTAAGLTAGTVTTNANLTGPITSTGNATAVAAQTGTGSTFVMNTSPTLISPALGTPASGVATNLTGFTSGQVTTALGYTPVNKAGDTMSGSLSMTSGFSYNWNNDLFLQRDAANTLAQRNGTNAQAFRLYRTFTDASNYATIESKFLGSTAQISIENLGTGGISALQLIGGNSTSNAALIQLDATSTQFGTGATGWQTVDATGIFPSANGVPTLGKAAIGYKQLYLDYTNTATVGAVTINKAAGRVNIAAAGTSVVVTNSLVTANSHVMAVMSTADATGRVISVVPAAGSFTINTVAVTAQASFDFFIVSSD